MEVFHTDPREAIEQHLEDLEDYYLAADAARNLGRSYSADEAKGELEMGSGKWGQCANLDRIQGADFEEAGSAGVGGETWAGCLGEDREFHQRRAVSLAAAVWQEERQNLKI